MKKKLTHRVPAVLWTKGGWHEEEANTRSTGNGDLETCMHGGMGGFGADRRDIMSHGIFHVPRSAETQNGITFLERCG
jgi:hypothetical protein